MNRTLAFPPHSSQDRPANRAELKLCASRPSSVHAEARVLNSSPHACARRLSAQPEAARFRNIGHPSREPNFTLIATSQEFSEPRCLKLAGTSATSARRFLAIFSFAPIVQPRHCEPCAAACRPKLDVLRG